MALTEGRWVTVKKNGPLHGRHIMIDGHGRILKGKGIPSRVVAKLNGNHREKLEGKDMEPHLNEEEALLHPLKEAARKADNPVEWFMDLAPEQQKTLKEHLAKSGKKMADLFKEWDGGTGEKKEWKDTNPTAMDDFTPGERKVHPHQVILGQQTKHTNATANADEDGIIELGPTFHEYHGYEKQAQGGPATKYGHLGHILLHELGHVVSTAHPGLHSHIMSNPQDALGRYNLRQQHFHGLSYTPEESWADAFASYHTDPEWLKEKHPQAYQFVQTVLKKIPDYENYIKALDKEYQAYSKHNDREKLPTREQARKIVAGRTPDHLQKSLLLYVQGPHARVMPRKVPQVAAEPSPEMDLSAVSGDPDYLTLYHKTPTRNVASIMESGLIPRYGKPTQGENPAYNAVYFHTNPSRTREFDTGEPSTVLKITLPINDDVAKRLYPDEDTMCKTAAECIQKGEPVAFRDTVSPEHILPLHIPANIPYEKEVGHSALIRMIDVKEHNHLTAEEIKQRLAEGGRRYVLTTIDPGTLNIEDEYKLLGVKGDFDQSKTKPIIVGKDGFIIDGRHRAASAKLSGVKEIRAYVPKKEIEKSLTGGVMMQPLLVINIEKSVSAPPKKWYQDILDAGGRWVTIKKEGPLHGRHILINGSGHIEAGKGIPPHILDKIRGGHIDDHKPYDEHPKDFDPDNAPEPEPEPEPEPAPKPTPAPAPKGKGEKTGFGSGVTMHVSDGAQRTIRHIKNLKHVHGGKWNAERERWEFNHAHGSEGHKALEEYAKNNGLDLHLINGDEEEAPGGGEDRPVFDNVGGATGKAKITGNTYPHKADIKRLFGAKWVGHKDENGKKTGHWEVGGVAHDSDLHKAMKKFAEERGLNVEHEHDAGAQPKEEPKKEPKIEPKEEPKDDETFRDLSKESFEDMMKNIPSAKQIADNIIHQAGQGNGLARGLEISDHLRARIEQDAEEFHLYMQNIAASPHLHEYAKSYMRRMGAENYQIPEYAENAFNYAENRYNEEKEEEERNKRNAENDKHIMSERPLADLVKNSPSLEDVLRHMIARSNKSRIHFGRTLLNVEENMMDPGFRAQAVDALDALDQIRHNPALLPLTEAELDREKNRFHGQDFDQLSSLRQAVSRAKEHVGTKVHVMADGKRIEFNPDKRLWGHVKGSRNSDHYFRVQVGDRSYPIPIPDSGKEMTKDYIAKWAQGTGDEAHSFIAHVLSKSDKPFVYNAPKRAKITGKFTQFEAPPERNISAYLDKAKEDMMAHGARSVLYEGKGTVKEKAETARIITTGMRALSHVIGENMPTVEIVIGSSGGGGTLAHYRPWLNSITIDPQRGRHSFVHEFGHFMDDAIHGMPGNLQKNMENFTYRRNKGGTYKKESPLHELARYLESTNSAKEKIEKIKERYGTRAEHYHYYKGDEERFARFFAQWFPHEAKKRGMDIPEELYNPYEIRNNYGEPYTEEELEKGGEMLKKILQEKGLWKSLLEFMSSLSGEPALYITL